VAYFGNEPFHLLAAQLVNSGKTPYLDFFYQHPPLFIYLNAAWMRVFGEDWRSAHVLSALLTSGSIAVAASYVYSVLSETRWRLALTVAAAALIGLNFNVLCYGTVALPFGLCLFLTIAAYRLTVAAVHRPGGLLPFLGGLAAGGAAASSLLTVPVLLVLALWLATESGWRGKQLSFVGGAVLPILPLIWLGLRAPERVFFDLIEYHLFHRAGSGANMIRWNAREVVDWFGSIQGLVLNALAAIGLSFAIRRPALYKERRGELLLCGWLTVVLSAYLSIPRPTFSFYFVLVTPFVSILAATGLQAMGAFGWFSGRRRWFAPALIVLYAIGLGWQAYKMRREIFYADHKAVEAIAKEVNRLTPPDGWAFAFEQVYFEARRTPPPGLENGFDPHSRRDEWLAANRFATVCVMANDPRVRSLDLFGRYSQSEAIATPNFTVYIFWDRVAAPSEPP